MNNQTSNHPHIHRLEQPEGATLAWTEDSGISLLAQDGLHFKDLARTGKLLPYEDWRLSDWTRATDLASRLSIEEIAGLMLYSSHQAVPSRAGGPFTNTYHGKTFEKSGSKPHDLADQQVRYIKEEHIRHILLFSVDDARTSARWNNNLQALAESEPHGIPVNISSDPRNGARDAGAEFKSAGSDVSKWPEGLGFAACFDPDIVRQFAEDASREYRALGITTALGPQIDLCTEPRWMRLVDTLGEHVEMTKQMTKAYCDGMQTTKGLTDSTSGWGADSVNTMVKHWPGGATGEGGRDAHYAFGQFAVYPGSNFEEHLKPFTEAAFCLDGPTSYASAVMPYYTVSWNIDTKNGKNVGNSYSEYIIRDLLRGKYDYQGVVCTDWGITADPDADMGSFGSRCYGCEQMTEAERCLTIILNGVDQFGGNDSAAPIVEAYRLGCEKLGEAVMRERMELSAARLLKNIFQCGLFEDPYLDPDTSAKIVGCRQFCEHGYEAQRKSVVLLKNHVIDAKAETPDASKKESPAVSKAKTAEDSEAETPEDSMQGVLPLKKGLRIYVPKRHISDSRGFFRQPIPAHTEVPVPMDTLKKYCIPVDCPEDADAALVFIESPSCNPYSEADAAQGGNGYFPITLQYRPYTAASAREESIAGGDFREASANRSYRGKTNTAYNEADLDNILECRMEMGRKPIIVCATVNNPMVFHEFEPQVDAIIAEFGVSKSAVLDVIFGDFDPTGRLPIQMPKDMETVEHHLEDRAFDLDVHVDTDGNAYDFGYGRSYEKVLPEYPNLI